MLAHKVTCIFVGCSVLDQSTASKFPQPRPPSKTFLVQNGKQPVSPHSWVFKRIVCAPICFDLCYFSYTQIQPLLLFVPMQLSCVTVTLCSNHLICFIAAAVLWMYHCCVKVATATAEAVLFDAALLWYNHFNQRHLQSYLLGMWHYMYRVSSKIP